jgi:MraZ protein
VAFRGTFDYTLDAKNRLTIPSKFRAQLAERIVLGRQTDTPHCIGVWRAEVHEQFTDEALAQYPALSHQRKDLERFFFANSYDTDLDSAGRVMVPATMLESAGIDKEVVVVGAGDRLEVWDRRAWNDHNATLAQTVADITAAIGNPA